MSYEIYKRGNLHAGLDLFGLANGIHGRWGGGVTETKIKIINNILFHVICKDNVRICMYIQYECAYIGQPTVNVLRLCRRLLQYILKLFPNFIFYFFTESHSTIFFEQLQISRLF